VAKGLGGGFRWLFGAIDQFACTSVVSEHLANLKSGSSTLLDACCFLISAFLSTARFICDFTNLLLSENVCGLFTYDVGGTNLRLRLGLRGCARSHVLPIRG
jgi:hypothetical protein